MPRPAKQLPRLLTPRLREALGDTPVVLFSQCELAGKRATVAKTATVQREGGRAVVRKVEYFNLDAILSVGYRASSKQGTQFRIWATQTLREISLEKRARAAAQSPLGF